MRTLYDIDSNLRLGKLEDVLKLPKIVRVNKFEEDSAKQFTEDMTAAQATGQEVIPILIDSYGGAVYALMSMIDTIKQCKVPVATVIEGKAMSCGAILATCGAEGMRFMAPHATMMIHDVSSVEFGKNEEIKAGAQHVEYLNNLVYKIMAENCGKEEKYFWNIVQEKGRADWYINAKEAKDHNLVNHIRVPDFKIKVTSSIKFG